MVDKTKRYRYFYSAYTTGSHRIWKWDTKSEEIKFINIGESTAWISHPQSLGRVWLDEFRIMREISEDEHLLLLL